MTKLIESITDRAALSAHVEGILDQCSYDCHHVHGTTTTLAAIIAPQWPRTGGRDVSHGLPGNLQR